MLWVSRTSLIYVFTMVCLLTIHTSDLPAQSSDWSAVLNETASVGPFAGPGGKNYTVRRCKEISYRVVHVRGLMI